MSCCVREKRVLTHPAVYVRTCWSCSSSCRCHPWKRPASEAATTGTSRAGPSTKSAGSWKSFPAGGSAGAVAVCLHPVSSQFEVLQCCCSDRPHCQSDHLQEKSTVLVTASTERPAPQLWNRSDRDYDRLKRWQGFRSRFGRFILAQMTCTFIEWLSDPKRRMKKLPLFKKVVTATKQFGSSGAWLHVNGWVQRTIPSQSRTLN